MRLRVLVGLFTLSVALVLVAPASIADCLRKSGCGIQDEYFTREVTDQIEPLNAGEKRQCGWGASLLDTFAQLALPADRIPRVKSDRTFFPVLLTDKTEANCYAVKIRPACVTRVEAEDAGYRITLAASRDPSAINETVRLSTSGEIDDARRNLQFFMLALSSASAAKLTADLKRKSEVYLHHCMRAGKPASCQASQRTCCLEQVGYYVERQFLERLRRARISPLHEENARRDHEAHVLHRFKSLDGYRRQLFNLLVSNEVCDRRTPIYGMTDAVAGNSGPSFGAHQLDIASNCRAQEAIREIAGSARTLLPGERTLQQRLREGYFNYPVRDYKMVKLRNFYTAVPKMNVLVASPSGRERADAEFERFLDDRIKKYEELQRTGRLPSQRVWVNLYVSDVSHQFGKSEFLETFVRNLEAGEGRTLTDAEYRNRLENRVLATTHGRKYPNDVRRRIKNVYNLYAEGRAPDRVLNPFIECQRS